eukprot:scaffold279218_cov30-Tisochrysis_lutea.AAC.5
MAGAAGMRRQLHFVGESQEIRRAPHLASLVVYAKYCHSHECLPPWVGALAVRASLHSDFVTAAENDNLPARFALVLTLRPASQR